MADSDQPSNVWEYQWNGQEQPAIQPQPPHSLAPMQPFASGGPPQQPYQRPMQQPYPPQNSAPAYPQPYQQQYPQQYQQPYPPQQPYGPPMYPQQYQQPQYAPQQQMYMPQQPVVVNVTNQQYAAPMYVQQRKQGPGCVVSTLYFVFIGSWLGMFWLSIALMLCCTIILIPVGMMMIKQLPMVFLLQPVN